MNNDYIKSITKRDLTKLFVFTFLAVGLTITGIIILFPITKHSLWALPFFIVSFFVNMIPLSVIRKYKTMAGVEFKYDKYSSINLYKKAYKKLKGDKK